MNPELINNMAQKMISPQSLATTNYDQDFGGNYQKAYDVKNDPSYKGVRKYNTGDGKEYAYNAKANRLYLPNSLYTPNQDTASSTKALSKTNKADYDKRVKSLSIPPKSYTANFSPTQTKYNDFYGGQAKYDKNPNYDLKAEAYRQAVDRDVRARFHPTLYATDPYDINPYLRN